MQGELIASKTSTTTTITVPVAADASGIGAYFFAIDGGAPVSNSTSRTKTFTGLAPLTPHLYEVTATDTMGNPSSNSLSLTVVTDAAGDDPSLVTKNIQVTLKGRDLSVRANAAGINWEWSDARGVVTSSGTGLVGSASGVLSVPIRTRLLSDGLGRLSLDNYNGGNILTYLATQLWVRVP
jgi:chitodextrinase